MYVWIVYIHACCIQLELYSLKLIVIIFSI